MNTGDIVSFNEPTWAKTKGQGKPPKGYTHTIDGKSYVFEWGKQLKVSSSCDPDNKVANLEYAGDYPLIRKEFAEERKEQITIHEKAESNG